MKDDRQSKQFYCNSWAYGLYGCVLVCGKL